MSRKVREIIKSILIVVLIATSVIQVGILWGYRNHRLPTSFFMAFFGAGESTVSDKTVRENIFLPFKMVLSSGSSSHWIVEGDNPLYDQLWKEGTRTLEGIAKGRYQKSGVLVLQEWRNITARSGVTYSFKVPMSPLLLGWFLGAGSEPDILSVLKMKIIPGVGGSTSEIFLYDAVGRIHKYTANDLFRGNSFRNMIKEIESGEDGTYREHIAMVDTNLDQSLRTEPDVLYTVKPPRFWTYYTVSAQVPETLADEDLLAEVLLGNEKDRYNRSASGGTVQFNTVYNLYMVSAGGILEYRHLQGLSASDKGAVNDALTKAYSFVEKVKGLLDPGTEIYLSDIDESNAGYYTFKFDYRAAGGKPVYFKKEMPDGGTDNGTAVSSGSAVSAGAKAAGNRASAIVINASAKRVLKCDWVLRDFSVVESGSYNDRYMEIMSNVSEGNWPDDIWDINMGYVMDMPDAGAKAKNLILKPSLIIEEKTNGNIKSVELMKRPGH
jgi:hypothetical protein